MRQRVTKETVAETMAALDARGEDYYSPSGLRQEIGYGSLSTISQYRDEVLAEKRAAEEPPDKMTPELIAALRNILQDHWTQPELAEIKDQLRREKEATAGVQKLHDKMETLRDAEVEKCEKLEGDKRELGEALAVARNQLEEVRKEREKAREAREAALTAAAAERQVAERKLEKLREEKDEFYQRAIRAEARLEALEQKRSAEIAASPRDAAHES